MRRASWFNVAAVALGLAFLYLPIAILVIYSFNASRLVTVWGGWSVRWYVELVNDRAMLEAAKAAASPSTKVVAVTVLTSLDGGDLRSIGVPSEPREQVELLAQLARSAGLDGIVCSGAEVAAAKAAWPDGFFVVPGVRPEGGDVSDQKRVVTPRQALNDGA